MNDPDVLAHLGRVTDEIQWLWWDQHVWRSFENIAERSDVARDTFFVAWVGELYYQRADLTIRAMRDSDPRSHSLRNLLATVKKNAADIQCPLPEMGSAGATTIDPAAVQADLDQLEASAAEVKVYVDKVLAHADESQEVPIPGPEVVDAAVQLLGDLLVKYTLILRNIDLELRSAPQYNWTAVFYQQWLKPDEPGVPPPTMTAATPT
jgi:hypothetical protein